MNHDLPRLPAHPAGEQPPIEQDAALAPATLDTWAGPVRVEWDPTAPLTPYGQLPFFIEYLKVASLFDALVADCPLAYTSPNPASPIRPSFGCGKRLFRRESPYKSASASPKTAAVPTYPVA